MNKILYFIGDVDVENTKMLIKELIQVDEDKKVTKITLYLNSCGGYFYPGLAVYDVIRALKKPVEIVTLGTCQSSAVMILQAASRRITMRNTVFMIHQLSHTVERVVNNNYKEISKEFLRNNETFIGLTVGRGTKECQKFISEITTDLYLDAEKMLELGLLDKIIDKI